MARKPKPKKKSGFFPPAAKSFIARRLKEALGIVVMTGGLGLAVALVSYNQADPSWNNASAAAAQNWLGLPGAYFADIFLQTLGLGAVILVLAPLAWGWFIARNRPKPLIWLNISLLPFAVLASSVFTATFSPPASWPIADGLGGFIGAALLRTLESQAYGLGLTADIRILASVLGLCSLALLIPTLGLSNQEWRGIGRMNLALIRLLRRYLVAIGHLVTAQFAFAGKTATTEHRTAQGAGRSAQRRIETSETSRVKDRPEPLREGARAQREQQHNLGLEPAGAFNLPPLNLLGGAPKNERRERVNQDALEQNARMLESVLEDFGIKGAILNVRPGPVVTLYELEPAPGIKSSRVIALADDIARSMSALSARIAVMPGRNVIGIELSNSKRETVYLRELLATQDFDNASARLALALGKDIAGAPVVADLSAMPHLLIAGTTGSGKSVALNTMILSLLYKLEPAQCRLIMIDPKMLELSVYEGIPHLLTPVVTDPKKAIVALKWTVREMEERYHNMSKLGVRNLGAYNKQLAEARATNQVLKRTVQIGFDPDSGKPVFEIQEFDLNPLPHIVVIVDEMADLMMVAGKDIEITVQRLAQMARAAGIHLIMATQRPSVDVITGTIKANFPTRISFQVTSKIDSRTILGEQGAEQLLGQGDMLYMAGGGRVTRVHGPFVSDKEVEKIASFLKAQGAPQYLDQVTEEPDEEDGFGFGLGSVGSGDELYDQAVALVAREGKASTSFIQRHLRIGYNRAARLIERMEKEGVVSESNHVGRREVLIQDHSRAG